MAQLWQSRNLITSFHIHSRRVPRLQSLQLSFFFDRSIWSPGPGVWGPASAGSLFPPRPRGPRLAIVIIASRLCDETYGLIKEAVPPSMPCSRCLWEVVMSLRKIGGSSLNSYSPAWTGLDYSTSVLKWFTDEELILALLHPIEPASIES